MISGNYMSTQRCNERLEGIRGHFYNVGFDDCKKQVPEYVTCPSVDCGSQCIEVLREKCIDKEKLYFDCKDFEEGGD